ncbi:MAG TPA: glycosyltransferase family 2 protein [Beijerinckiaceae bacterium]
MQAKPATEIDLGRSEPPARLAPEAGSAGVPRIAVLIPCYNEELTIASVVREFRAALPQAEVYVYDNNSKDRTVEVARAAGATVRSERRQGKGNVVRRMFADIDADVYVLVDGDDTYEAAAAPRLVAELIDNDFDFVNGARVSTAAAAYRRGHRFGNYALTELVRVIFGRQFTDMLSGYKALSARFVKSFPAMSSGFETETELAVHALELRMPCGEVETVYKERPEGSVSKLNTYRDGFRILKLIARLVKDERPLQFFGLAGLFMVLVAIVLGAPVVVAYLETGLVLRLPTAILSVGLVILGVLSFLAGLILDMVTRTRQEMKRLVYLSIRKQANPEPMSDSAAWVRWFQDELDQMVVKANRIRRFRDELAHVTVTTEDRAAFHTLAAEWRNGRGATSSARAMSAHPAYLRIIGMGERAVPLILADLQHEPDHWFVALHAITGANPVPEEARGRLPQMAQAWIQWGERNGYLSSEAMVPS